MLDSTGTLMLSIIKNFISSLQKRQDITDSLARMIQVFQFYLNQFPIDFNQMNTFCLNCSSNEYVDQFIEDNSLDFREEKSQLSVVCCDDPSSQISSALNLNLNNANSPSDQDNQSDSNRQQIISSETLQIESSPQIQHQQKTALPTVVPPLQIVTLPRVEISSLSLTEMPITTKRFSPTAITHSDEINNVQHSESFQNGLGTSKKDIKEGDNLSEFKQIDNNQAINKDLQIQQNYLGNNTNDQFQYLADDSASSYAPLGQYDQQPQQEINYGHLDYTDERHPAAQWSEMPSPLAFQQQLPPFGYNNHTNNLVLLPNSIPIVIPSSSVPFSFTQQQSQAYPLLDSQHHSLYPNDLSSYQYQYQREVFNPRKLLELLQNTLQTMQENSRAIMTDPSSNSIRSIAEEYRFIPKNNNLQFDLKHSMKKSLKNLVVYAHKDRIKASMFRIESDIRREMHNAKAKVNQLVFQIPNSPNQHIESSQTSQQSLSSKYMLERNRNNNNNNNNNENSRNIISNNNSTAIQQQVHQRLYSNSPHNNYLQISSDFQISSQVISSRNQEYHFEQEQQNQQNNFSGSNSCSHKRNNRSSRLYFNEVDSSPLQIYSLSKPSRDNSYISNNIYKQNNHSSSGLISNIPHQHIRQDDYSFNSFLNSKHLYIEDQQIY